VDDPSIQARFDADVRGRGGRVVSSRTISKRGSRPARRRTDPKPGDRSTVVLEDDRVVEVIALDRR